MEVTHCNGVGASGKGLAAHVCEETSDLVLVNLVELGVAALASVHNVLPQELLGDFTLLLLFGSLRLCLASSDFLLGGRDTLAAWVDAVSLVVDAMTIGIDQVALFIPKRARRVSTVV